MNPPSWLQYICYFCLHLGTAHWRQIGRGTRLERLIAQHSSITVVCWDGWVIVCKQCTGSPALLHGAETMWEVFRRLLKDLKEKHRSAIPIHSSLWDPVVPVTPNRPWRQMDPSDENPLISSFVSGFLCHCETQCSASSIFIALSLIPGSKRCQVWWW